MIHQTTVPYNPQQNGSAERLNGVLISTTTSLLEDANLAEGFGKTLYSLLATFIIGSLINQQIIRPLTKYYLRQR